MLEFDTVWNLTEKGTGMNQLEHLTRRHDGLIAAADGTIHVDREQIAGLQGHAQSHASSAPQCPDEAGQVEVTGETGRRVFIGDA